jgi:hypothetical protein
MFPEHAGWDTHAWLLGRAVDYLALNLWAKTKAGRRGYGRPKSVLPSGGRTRAAQARGSRRRGAPLSKVRERMAKLHARRKPSGPRHLDTKTDEEKLRDLFKD